MRLPDSRMTLPCLLAAIAALIQPVSAKEKHLLYVAEPGIRNYVDYGGVGVLAKLTPKSAAHNTIYSLDGTRAYLAGLKSPILSVADTATHTILKTVGPFANSIRPFTVNGSQTLCFVNVNELLGFEIGDLRTGKKLYRVEVEGYQKGKVKRHGCPSHGIGMTPDEKEIWLCDGANS